MQLLRLWESNGKTFKKGAFRESAFDKNSAKRWRKIHVCRLGILQQCINLQETTSGAILNTWQLLKSQNSNFYIETVVVICFLLVLLWEFLQMVRQNRSAWHRSAVLLIILESRIGALKLFLCYFDWLFRKVKLPLRQ